MVSQKSKELWDLVKSGKSNTRILGKIEQQLALRAEGERRPDVLHPSDMAKSDWCPRASYYTMAGYEAKQKKVHHRLRAVFDYGDSIHETWQSRLWELGVLSGKFACGACMNEWWATSPDHCPRCACVKDFLSYKEFPLFDREYRIGGHADGGLDDGHRTSALVEFKSIGIGTVRFEAPHLLKRHTYHTDKGPKVTDIEGLWKAIKTPFPSHMRQGQIYLWLSGKDVMIFIYESKMNQAAKEFVVKRDESKIDHLLDAAYDVGRALDKGKPPRRPSWAEPDSKVCKACPFLNECWGYEDGEYDEQETQVVFEPEDRKSEAASSRERSSGRASTRTRYSSRRVQESPRSPRRSIEVVRRPTHR